MSRDVEGDADFLGAKLDAILEQLEILNARGEKNQDKISDLVERIKAVFPHPPETPDSVPLTSMDDLAGLRR